MKTEQKKKVIKKVRKEIKTKLTQGEINEGYIDLENSGNLKGFKLPKNFGKMKNESKKIEYKIEFAEPKVKDAYKKGFEDAVLKFGEPKEKSNHAITIILVWLALLTALAIYKSL